MFEHLDSKMFAVNEYDLEIRRNYFQMKWEQIWLLSVRNQYLKRNETN